MKNNPLVSIIVPTYNRRNFLPINLRSLLNQTHKNLEILVVNDGGESVEDIVNSFGDIRIKYFEKENGGLADTRNFALKFATGDYVAMIDDDDGATEIFVEIMLRYLNNSDYKIAYCDSVRIHQKKDENGNYQTIWRDIPYSYDFNRDLLLVMNISPVNCFLIERECFNNVPPFDTDLLVYEDFKMNLELSIRYDFLHIPIPLVWHTFREDGSTMSSSRNFTTPIPGIYSKYFKYANNKIWVAQMMNQVLVSRGLQPMFRIEEKDDRA